MKLLLKPGKPSGEISQEAFDAYSEDVKKAQTLVSVKGRKRQTPLERGWTSANPQGRKFGPPESSDPDENMENFDTILISTTMLTSMTSLFGRVRKQRICMICGNRDGLLGYASVKAKIGAGPSLFRRAMNRAGNQVCFIDRYEDRTVFHDFYSQFGTTRMFVQQKPPGFGVSAHRIIQAACDLVGIKDLRVVIDGNINPINVLKCFMLGLLRQRTHQALANEKRLHLVELRSEMGNFPLVVASPEDGVVRTEDEIGKDEILDFEMISFDGHLPRIRAPYQPPPKSLDWNRKRAPYRTTRDARIRMMTEDDEIKSFLSDHFPECAPVETLKLKKSE